jgi:hypothetical protein
MTLTEVQQNEQHLTNSQAALKELAYLKLALDQHSIVAMPGVQSRIPFVNDKFCAVSRYSKEELIGPNHHILNSGHHPKEFFQLGKVRPPERVHEEADILAYGR